VQLWHGIPLKKLHLDSAATLKVRGVPDHRYVRALLARAYRFAGRGIGLFPVASELVAPRIVSAFGVRPERVLALGDIRDDALLGRDPATVRTDARMLLAEAAGGLEPSARVVLYAPTWRDGAADPGAPTGEEWAMIARWLEARDAVLLVRAHPLGLGDYAAGPAVSDRIRMLGSRELVDVTPALAGVDALVTDYSSIAYDFSLVGAPIVFLAPDVESYAKSRGLYEPYRAFSGGRHVTSWEHALAILEDRLREKKPGPHEAWLRNEYFDFADGHATPRVLDEIPARTGGSAAPVSAPIARPRSISGTASALTRPASRYACGTSKRCSWR